MLLKVENVALEVVGAYVSKNRVPIEERNPYIVENNSFNVRENLCRKT